MKKQPEITERTRQKFVDAFWALAKEKPIRKITVSELTRRAGYNRSTFYEYFLDTDDLLSYAEDRILAEIKQKLGQKLAECKSLEKLLNTDLFLILFSAMNEKVYLLLGTNGDPAFQAKIEAELLPAIMVYLPLQADQPNFDYLVSFVQSAAFSLLQHWNECGKNISADEISRLIQDLILHGALGSQYFNMIPQNTQTPDLAYHPVEETKGALFSTLTALWIPYMREIYRGDPEFHDTDEELTAGAAARVRAASKRSDMFFDLAYDTSQNCVGFLFYAVDHGGIPGVLPAGYGYIMEVYVAPEYRRHGYATQMFHRMAACFAGLQVGRLYLTPDSANGVPFWKSLGFADSGLTDPDNHMPIYTRQTPK